MVAGADSNAARHDKKMEDVNRFMADRQLPEGAQLRVRRYLEFLHRRRSASHDALAATAARP